jgi:tetratricopeptide (TPR) repeat protein
MYELLIIVAFSGFAFYNLNIRDDEFANTSRKIGERVGKLWDIAHRSMKENRMFRAEKALITILKIDEKNAAAYNRLGILYAKQKEYRDAIDCFEIASSLEATPSSLHNLGLIYFETENYDKAAIAFEQAIKLEDTLATRHVAYAKVQEKLGNHKLMIQELETAAKLEPTKEIYELLKSTYDHQGMAEESDRVSAILKKMSKQTKTTKRLLRPARRVII